MPTNDLVLFCDGMNLVTLCGYPVYHAHVRKANILPCILNTCFAALRLVHYAFSLDAVTNIINSFAVIEPSRTMVVHVFLFM